MEDAPCPHCLTLAAQLQVVTAERDTLVAEVQDLKAQLDADSTTSSLPPSTDKPWKPQSERVKTGRPSGGQPGHIGKTLEMSAHPDTVIVLPVTGRCACGQAWDEVLVCPPENGRS
ncbi:DUF6444 domain-containing protein [Deinococcus radiomollis]|uniref:DUF6444 domain-containing protein n=1 Tax=Deinococcus radiomollis TaxID=468916 RepID=UPI0038928991